MVKGFYVTGTRLKKMAKTDSDELLLPLPPDGPYSGKTNKTLGDVDLVKTSSQTSPHIHLFSYCPSGNSHGRTPNSTVMIKLCEENKWPSEKPIRSLMLWHSPDVVGFGHDVAALTSSLFGGSVVHSSVQLQRVVRGSVQLSRGGSRIFF